MAQAQNATRVGLALLSAAIALSPGCTVRTYDTPYYYRPQPQPAPRTYYAQPRQTAYAGAPAPQGAYGGAAYGQPAQYAPGAMGGSRYGMPAQPQYAPPYAPGAMGGSRYGVPAQPQYAPAPTVNYGPPPAAPAQPIVVQQGWAPQPMVGQPGAIWVPANSPQPVWTNESLMPGQWYVVEAWGVFSCWPNHNDGVDPYYAYAPWNAGTQPQPWAQLLINDRPMFEIARGNRNYVNYRPDHRYSTTMVGTGGRLKLQILDARNGSWGDNRGGLWVRVYPAQRR